MMLMLWQPTSIAQLAALPATSRRLLGGVNVDALDCGSTDAAAALAPDERFAHSTRAAMGLP
jgi:hypothetical protein